MSEQDEALGTVAGWMTREIIAAIFASQYLVRSIDKHAMDQIGKKELLQEVDTNMSNALWLADRLLETAKHTPTHTK